MNGFTCLEVNTKSLRKKFLSLPALIYKGDRNPRNKKEESQLIAGKHPLSETFSFIPFIILDKARQAVARCALTYYEDDDVAYLGFFDSFNNDEPVQLMFKEIERRARADGKKKILGPIDASVYINYRFKVDRFDKTYTSEPYNKEYYPQLWRNAGYVLSDNYISNQGRTIKEKDFDPRLDRMYERYIKRGYEFISPTKEDFDKRFQDVYELLIELYSNFTGYKTITWEQFNSLFSHLKLILNYDMVRLVYKDNKLYAFCVMLPNYGELTHGSVSFIDLIKISKIKKAPKEYVVLYVGASPKTLGLGGAIVYEAVKLLYEKNCAPIAALVKKGNVTGEMYLNLYEDEFNYILLSKEI